MMMMIMTSPSSRDPGFRFEFLDPASMQRARIRPRSLHTCMRQHVNDGFQILLGAFDGPGQGQDQGLVPDPGHGPRHHSNWISISKTM